MRFNLNLKKKFQKFCLLLICLVVLIFQSDIPNLKAFVFGNGVVNNFRNLKAYPKSAALDNILIFS